MHKSESTHPQRKASPVIVLLLGGILIALVVLIVVIAYDTAGGGNGSLATRGGATQPAMPIDTQRVRQTYKVGRSYRSLVNAELTSQATMKDWGVAEDSTMHFVSEAEIVRTIESNDGTTLVLTQEFRRARCISAFTRIDGLHIELGLPARTMLDVGGAALSDLPPGWTEITTSTANHLLANPDVLRFINQVVPDPTAKVKIFLDSLQGKTVRITYVNGRGMKSVEPIGCSLSDGEKNVILTTSVLSDAYIIPNLNSKPGDVWQVNAQDLQSMVDPSLRATIAGQLTAKRLADGGTPLAPTAEIQLEGSGLNLHDADQTTETLARWSPAGKCIFSFGDGIITQGELTGEFLVERHSTNHILFEARFTGRPRYRIVYSCEVLK